MCQAAVSRCQRRCQISDFSQTLFVEICHIGIYSSITVAMSLPAQKEATLSFDIVDSRFVLEPKTMFCHRKVCHKCMFIHNMSHLRKSMQRTEEHYEGLQCCSSNSLLKVKFCRFASFFSDCNIYWVSVFGAGLSAPHLQSPPRPLLNAANQFKIVVHEQPLLRMCLKFQNILGTLKLFHSYTTANIHVYSPNDAIVLS